MLVMKFGGSSVSKLSSVTAIAYLVQRELSRQPVLVVSALSGVTDLLVKLAESSSVEEREMLFAEIRHKHGSWIELTHAANLALQTQLAAQIDAYLLDLRKLLAEHAFASPAQLHDSVVAFGETMSSFLISNYLQEKGVKAQQVLATSCIVTSRHFGGADFISGATCSKTKKVILPLIKAGIVPVITGFIGATSQGETTILGRGGSDYSAAIVGYAIQAKEVQIWTDVDGVFSADPRIISQAHPIRQLSYQEAAELAMFGAKVLHPRTIQPAVKGNIPVRVLNTFSIDKPGTLIEHAATSTDVLVKAITWRQQVPLINIYSADMFLCKGFLQKIFAVLARNNISVNMLSASEVSVSLTLDNIGNLELALSELNKFAKTDYFEDYGTVSLVGEQIMTRPDLMQDLFDILASSATPVEMLSYSASNINISVIVPSNKINTLVPLLHQHFIDTSGI